MANPSDFVFVVCGQASTGRLEVLESFLKKRFRDLFVIGTSSIFADHNTARCTIYKAGVKYRENKIFNLVISRKNRFKGLFFLLTYTIYFFSVFFCVLRFRLSRRNLVFVGIGFFPSILGIFLKRIKLVKKVIYYSIDYFSPLTKTFISKMFVSLDKCCVKRSDFVWSISPKILEARGRFARYYPGRYRNIPVPLCFDESRLKYKDVSAVERWSVVFVGTSGYFHGLHLLIETMPQLIKIFPRIKVKIIGPGPWGDTQKKVSDLDLAGHFDFLGFIKEETELFDLVSGCAVGVALYVPEDNNPAFFADPGKPKLYAFCAVPVIISKAPPVAEEINACGAGKAIDFNTGSLVKAMAEILSDDTEWNRFRKNAFDFAARYTSERVLGPAIEESVKILVN